MRFGLCCDMRSFAPVGQSAPLAGLPDMMALFQDAGVDYFEWQVHLAAAPDQAAFEELKAALAQYPLRPEGFVVLLPKQHRLTGPQADHAAALAYCRTALKRCRTLGADIVALGSGGARRIPDGFDPQQGRAQFVAFCKALGNLARDAGVVIAVEPLNKKEDNLVNTVQEGAAIVDEVAHPSVRLLADMYHLGLENEPLAHVAAAGARVAHTHVADLDRVAPGTSTRGEQDFVGFFRALRRAGYNGRCTMECGLKPPQIKPALVLLRKRWQESAQE